MSKALHENIPRSLYFMRSFLYMKSGFSDSASMDQRTHFPFIFFSSSISLKWQSIF